MPTAFHALVSLFPGSPGRGANETVDAGEFPASGRLIRVLALGMVFAAGCLALTGFLCMGWGVYHLAADFSGWAALASQAFYARIALVLLGAALVFEAFWPWILRVGADSPWSYALASEDNDGPYPWIRQWCREMKLPEPSEVEITWETNAALDLQAAVQGVIRLRIGMPLCLGLSREQFQAVVLHELGHFYHRARLPAVLRHQELGRRIAMGALYRGHPFWFAASALWRRIEKSAQPWLHALEEEADHFAHRHGSGHALGAAMLSLKVLEQANSQTMRTVQAAMATGMLPNDLVALFRQEKRTLMGPLILALQRRALEQPATLTHPAVKERVGESLPRVPAGGLTEDMAWIPSGTLCRKMTESYYRHELGEECSQLGRVSVDDARCQLSRSQDAHSALEHYFLGLVKDAAPVRPLPQAMDKEREWLGGMNAVARLPLIRKTLIQRREAWLAERGRWEKASSVCRILAGGERPQEKLPGSSQEVLLNQMVIRDTAAAEIRNATEQLSQKLTYGLLLLDLPEVTSAWPEARLWRKVAVAWKEELPLLSKLLAMLEEASLDVARLAGLESMSASRRRVCEIEARRQIWQALSKVVGALSHKTLSDPVFHQNASELFERQGSMTTQVLVEKLENLYARMGQAYLQGLGDLAYAAGKAELAAGIKPWE